MNLGFGRGRSVLELDSIIREYVGTDDEPAFGPPLPEEIQRIALDSSRAAEILGWKPSIPFQQGLRDLVNYHRARLEDA